MNKIRVSRRPSAFPRVTGNLAPVIRRVQQNVIQNIRHSVRPRLAFAVFVSHRLEEVFGCNRLQIFPPQSAHLARLRLALIEIRFRPDRQTLRLLSDSFQPQPLGRNDMRHQLQRALIGAARTQRRDHFSIGPFVVNKLPAQRVHKIHKLTSSSLDDSYRGIASAMRKTRAGRSALAAALPPTMHGPPVVTILLQFPAKLGSLI
jgi:hypothetical protein